MFKVSLYKLNLFSLMVLLALASLRCVTTFCPGKAGIGAQHSHTLSEHRKHSRQTHKVVVNDSSRSVGIGIMSEAETLQQNSHPSSLWSSEFAPSPADPLAHLRRQPVTATPMPLSQAFTNLPGCQDLRVSELALRTEDSDQGDVHALFIGPPEDQIPSVSKEGRKLAVVICMHATTFSRSMMLPRMQRMAKRGYLTVAIDSRYHGHRAKGTGMESYKAALIEAWREGNSRPFLLDPLWDIKCLVDYLTTRPDVDPERIGITGVSLGGMLSWFAAFADPRIAVSVPMIGVQNFGWAIENERWQGRVASIPWVFEAAKQDLNKPEIDSEVVSAVWGQLCPSLLSRWDAPLSLPCVAPRPMLILATDQDPACPVQGLEQPLQAAKEAYTSLGAENNFQFHVEEGLGHEVNDNMELLADAWFDKYL